MFFFVFFNNKKNFVFALQCTKACGGGQKTRKVLCLQENETVAISNCDGNSVPFSSESCNNHPCGEDEVSAVVESHDLREDDEEDCEEDEDEEMTSPLDTSGSVRKLSSLIQRPMFESLVKYFHSVADSSILRVF